MCTVTYIPTEGGIYLTSNRDEWQSRTPALAPEIFKGKGGAELAYPKDGKFGGSWIASKSNGDAAVLLNGAFNPHVRLNSYRKSRGLVFLEILWSKRPDLHFDRINLHNIEPFTLILLTRKQLYECTWDGEIKHRASHCANTPHIWSSVTLYDEAARGMRQSWFMKWQNSIGSVTEQQVLQFHRYAGTDDPANDIIMKRKNGISTVSITSIYLSPSSTRLSYHDLHKDTFHETMLPVYHQTQSKKVKSLQDLKLVTRTILIRARHWEYWPFHLVYFPVYIYWMWLSIKARSFFFFSMANPLIKNAGFLLESKKQIYDLMPAGCYPAGILCRIGITQNELQRVLSDKKLTFPMIAKPDIGQRGVQVKLLHSMADLYAYSASMKVDFLLQEYVDYPNEIGIFYYRIPGEPSGRISGIVGKEFVTVIGDGISKIEELLMKEKRYVLQLVALRKTYGDSLHTVLPIGVKHKLVPYGNHSRGARFTDQTKQANVALNNTIDRLCQCIPEFYYGRLDVKFNSWEELEAGKEFSIIELNGAGSEPTHIYDPSHSIFFAWREIIVHLNILYRISRINAKRKGKHFMSTRQGWTMLKDNAAYLKLLSS
ncbi:MAG: NRDE family protein [Chitinophagaceae bacterium]|nr:NRDE family protein [Chitinophagaceae bacterium]